MTFSPELGNVAFASAMDGWGFCTKHFARMYAARMGCSAAALEQCLWGDFRIDGKTKKVMRIKRDQQQKYRPLFVQAGAMAGCMSRAIPTCHLDRHCGVICR